MSETKFTPGPWTQQWNGYFFDISQEGNPFDLASVNSAWDEQCGPGTQEGNAHLIAAAPELYEALAAFERVVDLWLPADSEVDVEHYGEAEALAGLRRTMVDALAKARGQS